MAVRGLEQTTSRLDQVKRLGGLVLVAVIIAALVVGAFILTGLFAFTPVPQVRVLGFRIPPEWTAFIGAFSIALMFILAYVYYAKLVRNSLQRAKKLWFGLPEPIQEFVLALQAALVAGAAVYLTHQYLFTFQTITLVAVPVGVGVLVLLLTMRVRSRGWTLVEWARTLYLSALVAALVALLVTFAFAGVAPGYTPPTVFLVGWGVCLYLLFRRHQTIEDSVVTRLLTRSGYAQMRQIETVSVSVVTGLVLAALVAALVGALGTTPDSAFRRALLSVALVWPVVTIATSIGWPTSERIALVIEDINVRSSTGNREVTIRNTGNETVNLRGAKITDAHNGLYQISIDISLGAGEAAKFEVPESFELAVHDRYEVSGLPFGLALMRDATEPTVVTRRGRAYLLIWVDQLSEYTETGTEAETTETDAAAA